MLDKIFDIQLKHNKQWQDQDKFTHDKKYRLTVLKDMVIGIFNQTASLLRTFNWSNHILQRKEDTRNSKEQLIDIVKYSIGTFILLGGDEFEFLELFEQKSAELDIRWKHNKKELKETTDVVIFDIDGVLADYLGEYEKFIMSKGYVKNEHGGKFYSASFNFVGLTRQQEEKINDEFIRDGGFLRLDPYKEMVDVTKQLKKLYGCEIILLTARPNWVYSRLTMDTNNWLKNNGIEYDLLLWDKDKADSILNNIMPANVLCMIEDRDKHALELSHIGIDVLLIDKPYNQSISNLDNIQRIYNSKEIIEFVNNKIEAMK